MLMMSLSRIAADDTPEDLSENDMKEMREAIMQSEVLTRGLIKYITAASRSRAIARTSTRSKYMHTLREIIGACPSKEEREWKDE